jgi:hypothetical protein
MTTLDARRAGYGRSLFVDATHLNGRGAIALSRAVARALKAESSLPLPKSAPRWIALGPPRHGPSEFDFRLEDLEHSKKFLKLAATPD